MGYFYDLYGKRSPDFVKGVLAGLMAYAWWKDGTQYVGTCGETLKEACYEVVKDLAENPSEFDVDKIIHKGFV